MTVDDLLTVERGKGIFKVARRSYVDPLLYDAEVDAIFSKCWLYVAHESEVPNSHDFVIRNVGGRPILLTRDGDKKLRCFLNVCPHRGAQVCRERRGNAKTFSCLYHGWTFASSGKVRSITEMQTYGASFNSEGQNDLVPVPKLDAYRGFIFLNYDHSACSLEEYLAGACEQIDLIVDPAESGMEIIPGSQEYSIRANWKLLSENSVDIAHGPVLHATYLDLIANNSDRSMPYNPNMEGACLDLGNGHVVAERRAFQGRPIAQWIPHWGQAAKAEINQAYGRLVTRYGEARARRMAKFNRNMLIFPNLAINDVMAITIRTWQPAGPGAMNITAWALAPVEERGTPALKRRLTNFNEFFGPGGFASPDDAEALESCQRSFQAWREAPWNDLSKGFVHDDNHPNGERAQRVFWLKWRDSVSRSLAAS